MRQIGNIPDETQARIFGDFLFAKGIQNNIEPDADNTWAVWVVDEDQLASAQAWLERFHANPGGAEFITTAATAPGLRKAMAEKLAGYQQQVRTRQSMFPPLGAYGATPLTYGLIVICVIVAFYSGLGKNDGFLSHFFITEAYGRYNGFLPEVFHGQVWRLFTPIFIHFGVLHLVFNMMWLNQLGRMIEGRQGTGMLAALVGVIALVSNLSQYYFSGSPFFGGMSGVVYGLAGYVWMQGRYRRSSGLFLDSQNVIILIIWLVLCYTGTMGPVANTAHLTGLLSGVIWGRASAFLAAGRVE